MNFTKNIVSKEFSSNILGDSKNLTINKIKILHLEDSLGDSDLIQTLINSANIAFDYFLCETEKEFLTILETETIDIILSDYTLLTFSGNKALKLARDNYPHIPFIFVTGTMGEDAAINAMVNGATDYVLKHNLERLVPAIDRAISEFRLKIKSQFAEAALQASEKKYSNLINEVNDGYFTTDSKGIITFANKSMAHILKIAHASELEGHFFTDYINFNHVNDIQKTFKKIIESKREWVELEMEVLPSDGSLVYIEIKIVPLIERLVIIGLQGVIHDITERKQAEINLKEKNILIEAQIEKYSAMNKELIFQNEEKEKRAAELLIANQELVFQNHEKQQRAAELITANIQMEEEKKYKLIIEKKNKNITDSLNYAKLIQLAKLPNIEKIIHSLPQSFVLYKPKDIISGDFYFFHKTDPWVFIAAADCTGHGIPGALLSMIGSDKLLEAVIHDSEPSKILMHLNRGMKNSLHQNTNIATTSDGMDISICAINVKERIVKYSGANSPLLLIKNGQTEMDEIKATERSIGGSTSKDQHFASHELKLAEGDTFYLTTDGYADQYGGVNGKKLMRTKFKEILVNIQNKSMSEQQEYLEAFIED
ncbi:MAG: SpoIIE family protein phosphatase [Salinivirgaceae bacterium]